MLILIWILFFPDKESTFYFLGFSILIGLVLIRNIYFLKTIGLSYYSHFLIVFNFILIISIFFSNYGFKSILFYADIFLCSSYFLLFYYSRRLKTWYFHLLAYIISFFSIITFILFLIPKEGQRRIFYISAIHEGIICGIGVLILVYYLLKKWNPLYLVLLVINLGGLFVSQSKAAYIGTVFFVFLMVISKKKRLIPFVVLFIILTFLIPNPLRTMFFYSINKDPYALDRLNIWKMSLEIFKDHPFTGVGLDNFQEVAGKYNFKQNHGPANYFKVPRLPHSDYMKLLSELGIIGFFIILGLFYAAGKRIFSSPFPGISAILLLYLLFQAFLFNILFSYFFFFILLFLLKDMLEQEKDITFRSFTLKFKTFLSFLLICVWLVGFFFPWQSEIYIENSKQSTNLVNSFNSLKKAQFFNPFNQTIYQLKATLLKEYFKETANLESFYTALGNVKTVERLNPYYLEAYLMEFDLYKEIFQQKMASISIEEIIDPLKCAETIEPFNPFIKLTKAHFYLNFDYKEKAEQEALKALELEPEFAAALYFMQSNFNYFHDTTIFQKKMEHIAQKHKALHPVPGSYLDKLFQLPDQYKNGGKDQ